MEKFGLGADVSGKSHSALEFEILQEQSAALGKADRDLQRAIERYGNAIADTLNSDDENQEDKLLDDIAKCVWHLIMQREFLGFVHENVKWVTENFDVPQAALNRMGSGTPSR